MLYLDYSRKAGEWIPNQFGGRENLEAIEFLKKFNHVTQTDIPGVMTIAEESTAWPQVTRPPYMGGLGFSFKWNMGWMHDTLAYFSHDPVHRKYHQNDLTFAMLYHHTRISSCRCRTTKWSMANVRCSAKCRATTGSGSPTCAPCSPINGFFPAKNCC